MRRILMLMACLCGLPGFAAAQVPAPVTDDPQGRVQGALTSALGIPWGRVGQTTFSDPEDLGSMISHSVEIGLHLGIRLGHRWSIGGYAELGFPTAVTPGNTGASAYKLGIEASLRTWVGPSRSLWTSFGIGYESLEIRHREFRDQSTGWELARLATGWEWSVRSWAALGPYFQATLGVYPWRTTSAYVADAGPEDIETSTCDVPMRAHGWLVFGLSGHFGP